MAPSPDDANQATAVTAAVTDASDAPSPPKQPVPPPPPLPPIATLASDPRTAFSAKGRRREESCQTATKSCDRRQVDFSSVSRLSRLQHFTFVLSVYGFSSSSIVAGKWTILIFEEQVA